jgi:hypothetical protein
MRLGAASAIVLLNGCAAATVGGRAGYEMVSTAGIGVVPSINVAPVLASGIRSGSSTGSMTYAPRLSLEARDGGASRLYQQLGLSWQRTSRSAMAPYAELAGGIGRTRALDVLPPEDAVIQPRPDVATLNSYAFSTEVGIRGPTSARSSAGFALLAQQSGGIGSDAGALPPSSQFGVVATARRGVTRRTLTGLDGSLRQVAFSGLPATTVLDLAAMMSRDLSHRTSIGFSAGTGIARSAPSLFPVAITALPALGASISYATTGVTLQARAGLVPGIDRLDGQFQQRVAVMIAATTDAIPRTMLSGSLRLASDLGTDPAQRQRIGIGVLSARVRITNTMTTDAGISAYVQPGTGPTAAPTEIRFFLGWSILAPAPRGA